MFLFLRQKNFAKFFFQKKTVKFWVPADYSRSLGWGLKDTGTA